MEKEDKQEILEALGALATQVKERMDGLKTRMSGTEERIGSLAQEICASFGSVDRRLVSLEDKVDGIEKSFDEILEGDVLGKNHITLTRPEYDTIMETAHLPNRFASQTP